MKINRATPEKHKYLHLLGVIPTPPETIFFTGKLLARRVPIVVIVGTRKSTTSGHASSAKLSPLMEIGGTLRALGANQWTIY